MTYLITSPKPFMQADGTPFRIPKRDEDKNLIMRKAENGQVLVGSDGSALIERQDANFTDIMRAFLNGIFKLSEQRKIAAIQNKKDIRTEHDLVMEDSAFATDIFRALNVAGSGQLELEKAPYEWIRAQIEIWGIDLYGINAAVLKEVFKNAEDVAPTRAENHLGVASHGLLMGRP